MRAVTLISTVLVAALLAQPASAGAVTFGADLQQRTANSTATCGYPPYYPGFYAWGSSCTFFSTATPTAQASETQVVPLPDPAVHGNQSGTITAVRIKTGPYQAGPAKLTVLRAHRAFNGGEAACCVGQAESAQFTLTPNSIVNVATDLPVESRYDAAQRIYTYDSLALSVLDATTPIPAEFSGDPNGYCSTGYFPYVQTGQERFSGEYNVCGFLVLMQADMTINGGGEPPPAPPPPPPPPPAAPTLKFPTDQARIVGRTARIPLRCAGDVVCEGILRLQAVGARQPSAARTSKANKVVTYATGRFKISPGSTKTVRARLSKRGRKLLRGRKTVHVYANATLGAGQAIRKKIALKVR
jgi:hypothetical protein